MDPSRAPLLEAVREVAQRKGLRLHTPMHQGAVDPGFAELMGTAIVADLTELDETDDLRCPQGAIAEAQALAAAHWGADRTFFLVQGASTGNLAALRACRDARPIQGARATIAIGRNAHVSAIGGLILSDWEPVWVPARWDARWNVAMPPDAAAFATALEAHPDCEAVFVTSPGYFGDAVSISDIRRVAGDRPLIVDEAHGAHRPVALSGGADVVIHSAHKGLSGPTQGGYLHVRGDRVDPEAIASALRLLQTTSPSYWILAGLDAARRWAAVGRPHEGPEPAAILARATGLPIRPSSDGSRVLVGFADGLSAADRLSERGVVVEAALSSGVLLLVGPGSADRLEDVARELVAVAAIMGPADLQLEAAGPRGEPPSALPLRRLSPAEASRRPAQNTPIAGAVGRICAESICPYPPGIPLLVPGEECDPASLDRLARLGLEVVRTVQH